MAGTAADAPVTVILDFSIRHTVVPCLPV